MLDGHQTQSEDDPTPLGLSLQDRMALAVRDLGVLMTEDVPPEIEAAPMVSDPDDLSAEAPDPALCQDSR